jgi:hypothetical protein
VKAGWRKLNNAEVHNVYFPLNTIRHIISTRMRWRAGSMHVMRLYMPTEFLLAILQRTSRSVYELNTNRYSSVEHSHVFQSRVTKRCGLKRPSSGNHYKNFKIRYSTVQIVLVVWDTI